MISDSFDNSARYHIPYFAQIARFLEERGSAEISEGEIEILGRDLFVRVSEYVPGRPDKKQFEAHRIYADFQFIAAGREIIQYTSEPNLKSSAHYDEREDIQFFETPSDLSSLVVFAGQFVFFFPGELHRPCCQADPNPGKVRKLVFKIRMGKQNT